MNNEEIITRLNNTKRRARSQKRDQCITIIFTPDGFVKMFDANGTVKKPIRKLKESIIDSAWINERL